MAVQTMIGDAFALTRNPAKIKALGSETRKPFRFFLCGDPEFIASFRAMLLRSANGSETMDDSAGTLETIVPGRSFVPADDARCVLFFGRPGDRELARLDLVQTLKLPIFSVIVDPEASPQIAPAAPAPGMIGEYIVPSLERDALRSRLFPHLVEVCRGVEIAVGRRLPALRESIGMKLTRDAATTSLTIAAASAVVDHVPLLGFILGPLTAVGDTVAITGVQINLLLQIGSAYGKDPDVHRVWETLPIVGGGLGWRAISRELSGFFPVAGVAVKSAIAYAGTIVVGEGIVFYYEYGRHMTKNEASARFEETKRTAFGLLREFRRRISRK